MPITISSLARVKASPRTNCTRVMAPRRASPSTMTIGQGMRRDGGFGSAPGSVMGQGYGLVRDRTDPC